jgi:MFS family permease
MDLLPVETHPRRSWALDARPLGVPAFRRLWLASVVTAVGGSFSLVAVPAYLFARTGSSAAIGAAAAVSLGTLVVAAVGAGALADAVDRRRLLLAANATLAATYALMWLHAALSLRSTGLLLGLVAGQGLALGAILTVTGAVVPRLVPADLLAAASSVASLVRYAGAVAGPLLAAVLIPVTGLATLFLLDAAALLAALVAVARLPPLPPDGAARPEGAGRNPAAGVRFLLRDRLLRAVLGVDLAAMVLGMPAALFPELAHAAFGGPSGGGTELGLLYAAYPAGVCAAALVSGTFTRTRRQGALMAAAAAAWGGTVVVLGLAPHLAVAVGALLLGGAVNLVLSACRNAITQAHTDDALRGRTQGALTVVLFGGPQVAAVLHGPGGAAAGPRTATCAGGLLTVLAVAAIVRASPELRRYEPGRPLERRSPTPAPWPGSPGPPADARRTASRRSRRRGTPSPRR